MHCYVSLMLLLIKAKLAPCLVSYLLVGLQMCMQMPPTPGGHYLIPVLQHPMNGRSVYWSVQETCSTTYQIHKRNIYSGTYFTLIYLQSLGPQTSTSTISTASVHQSPWTARTFQLTLITSQLDYCNSFTWFAPKIPPQTETHADPCCTYHPDLPPLRTDPQFSNSLKSCFSPSNRSIISLTEMVKSTLHSMDFLSTVGKHADVQGGQCLTCKYLRCYLSHAGRCFNRMHHPNLH